MGGARQDVERLFGHFGLDPADYVANFTHATEPPSAGESAAGSAARDAGITADEPDLFDYRNFDLNR